MLTHVCFVIRAPRKLYDMCACCGTCICVALLKGEAIADIFESCGFKYDDAFRKLVETYGEPQQKVVAQQTKTLSGVYASACTRDVLHKLAEMFGDPREGRFTTRHALNVKTRLRAGVCASQLSPLILFHFMFFFVCVNLYLIFIFKERPSTHQRPKCGFPLANRLQIYTRNTDKKPLGTHKPGICVSTMPQLPSLQVLSEHERGVHDYSTKETYNVCMCFSCGRACMFASAYACGRACMVAGRVWLRARICA